MDIETSQTSQKSQEDSGDNSNNRSSPESSNKEETPKKKEIRSRKFCFTTNNYDTSQYSKILAFCKEQKTYVIGKEIGESGTPHLQGYVETKNQMTLKAINKKIEHSNISTKRDTDMAAALYCMKDFDYVTNITKWKPTRKVKDPMEGLTFYNYQQEIINIIEAGGEDRKINWYWEKIGNVGKSAFCKHLCLKYKDRVIILDGKKSDMFNGILEFKKKAGDYPEIVIIDTPRSIEHISYGGMEKVKDGCFYSGKYEGGMAIFNCPVIIVFSNQLPDRTKMSADRWNINEINIHPDDSDDDDVDT